MRRGGGLNARGNVLLPHVAIPVSGAFMKALVESREFGQRANKFDLWVGQLAGLGRSRPRIAALEDLRQLASIESACPVLAAGVEEVEHSSRLVQESHSVDAAVNYPADLLAETLGSGALLAANSSFLIEGKKAVQNQ